MVFGAGVSRIPTGPVIRGAGKLIVAERDVATFHLTHDKELPLFGKILVSKEEEQRHERDEDEKGVQGGGDQNDSWFQYIDLSKGDPPLKRPHESNTIQLFYDLFFVANLTTFTSVHEINDKDSKFTATMRLFSRLTRTKQLSKAMLASSACCGSLGFK